MKTIARFITRGSGADGEGTVDLILGVGFKNGNLKPNTIYEICSVLGETVLIEVGRGRFDKKMWFKDASTIISEDFPHALLTEEESKARK